MCLRFDMDLVYINLLFHIFHQHIHIYNYILDYQLAIEYKYHHFGTGNLLEHYKYTMVAKVDTYI